VATVLVTAAGAPGCPRLIRALREAGHTVVGTDANPRSAVLTEAWWQFDLSGAVIVAMEKLGLVREVVRRAPRPAAAAPAQS